MKTRYWIKRKLQPKQEISLSQQMDNIFMNIKMDVSICGIVKKMERIHKKKVNIYSPMWKKTMMQLDTTGSLRYTVSDGRFRSQVRATYAYDAERESTSY